MGERDDRSLELALRQALREAAERAPLSLTSAAIERRARERRAANRRSVLTLLGVAAIVALPVAALIGRQLPDNTPRGAREAVIVRAPGTAIEAWTVRADGFERLVRRLDVDTFAVTDAEVSSDGWLAIGYRATFNGPQEWLLVNLADSASRPTGVAQPELGEQSTGGWAPDGRFSMWGTDGRVVLVDPTSGATEEADLGGRVPLILGWAADGSGLVVGDGGRLADETWAYDYPIYGNIGGPYLVDWRVARVDGGPDVAGLPELQARPLPRLYAAGGVRLQVCDSSERGQQQGCPDLPNGAVIVERRDGAITTAYKDELAPDRVVDAMLAADGEDIWLLSRAAERPAYDLSRFGSGGSTTTVASWGTDVIAEDPAAFVALSPDDSLAFIYPTGYPGIDGSQLLGVSTATGAVTEHTGTLAGYISAAAADGWLGEPTATRAPVPALAGSGPSYRDLAPIDQLIGEQLTPGTDRAVLVREHLPSAVGAGTPITVDLGTAPLQEGYGVLLRCSGPSDVSLTLNLPDAFFGPALTNRCLSPSVAVGGSTDASINRAVRVTVTADPATAWQVVIFDPAPSQ